MEDSQAFVALEEGYLRAFLDLTAEIDEYLEQQDLSFRGAFLRGMHPNTELVVKCLSRRTGREGVLWCPVWEIFAIGGKQMPPDVGAGIIATNVMEGIWEWSDP